MLSKYIKQQTEDTYNWVITLVEDIPEELWDSIPENVNSNISWQVGHLIMSFYFHSVMVIKGHDMEIVQKIPLQEYNKLFTKAAATVCVGKTSPKQLLKQLKLVQVSSLKIIDALNELDLNEALEKTDIEHPIAKTKLEALDWNIKHTMWHCGQIAILKRVLHKKMEFGLRV